MKELHHTLMKNTGSYVDALEYGDRLRHQPPAIYNIARTREKPIPQTEIVANEVTNSIGDDVFEPFGNEQNDEIDGYDNRIDQEEELEQEQAQDQEDEEVPSLLIDFKQEDPLDIPEKDQTELNAILVDDGNVSSDDDVIWESGNVPMPKLWCTEDVLTKHENDTISGKLPYAIKVSQSC